MGRPTPENLVPFTSENARESQLKGAKKRKENTAKRKLVSEVLIEALQKKYDVGKGKEKKTGYEILGQVAIEIIAKKNSASVSMIREIINATEGQKIKFAGEPLNINLNPLSESDYKDDSNVEVSPENE